MADHPIILNVSDFEQITVRIYKADHRALLQRQVDDVTAGKRKPSLAELVHQAIEKLRAA